MTTVRDNGEQHRYEILDGADVGAFLDYRLDGTVAEFVHTETLDGYEGRGLGSQLVRGALEDARKRGWQVVPTCPFVRKYIEKHADYVDLVPSEQRSRFKLDA